jgi:signal peptidase I
MSFALATPLPLVVVESCSMYHSTEFDDWWEKNEPWYEARRIYEYNFSDFPFKNGLNKGDIILVSGRGKYNVGDIIIFKSNYQYPLIHRLIDTDPYATKGDKNFDQLDAERSIEDDQVLGKAVVRVPGLGWLKLIFFEGTKPSDQRGFCKSQS